MSCHCIYYQNGAKLMRAVTGRAEYLALRNDPANRRHTEAARQGDEAAKRRLLQMNYSCLPAEGGRLKGATQMTDTVGMDLDFSPDDPDCAAKTAALPATVLAHKDELGLLLLERSARKGFHIVFRRRPALTQEQNLQWAAGLLGVEFDHGAKDITRVFFTTTADPQDLLYLDDRLFLTGTPTPMPDTPTTTASATPMTTATPTATPDTPQEPATPETPQEPAGEVTPEAATATYRGHTFAAIIDKFFGLYNGGETPIEGNRNVLTFELAKALRCICDYRIDRLRALIPRYAGLPADEWARTLENANNEPRRGMSFRMRQVLQALDEQRPPLPDDSRSLTADVPPALPHPLPEPLRSLSAKAPDYYRPAICEAVFPALAAHLHGVRFRYWDNVEHEATFMNVLVAPMSIGKGCIRRPIAFLLEDLLQRDRTSRDREQEWKARNPSSKQNRQPRPTDICIQVLIDNLTDAVFNQRVADAARNGGRYLYTQCDELDTLKQITSRGTPEQVSILIRKAFDNSLHGQERVGPDAVTGIAPLRFNFNASTTLANCRRFFGRGVNDGTVTRLSLSTIVKPVDARLPEFGEYDEAYAEMVRTYVERLDKASGLVLCPQANRLALRLADENERLASLYDSEAYLVLSYRATVIAWLKGMVLFLLGGGRWSRQIEQYVAWSLRYDLWCKMRIFGPQLDSELYEEGCKARVCRQQNLLSQLPPHFRLADLERLRKPNGRQVSNARDLLRVWRKRGYVDYESPDGDITNRMSGTDL